MALLGLSSQRVETYELRNLVCREQGVLDILPLKPLVPKGIVLLHKGAIDRQWR